MRPRVGNWHGPYEINRAGPSAPPPPPRVPVEFVLQEQGLEAGEGRADAEVDLLPRVDRARGGLVGGTERGEGARDLRFGQR